MSASKGLGEMIEIKTLLKTLVDSQTKSQQQIIELLKCTAGHKQQEEDTANNEESDDNYFEASADNGIQAYYEPGRHDQLYEAIKNNEWEKATNYLMANPEAINEGIAHDSSTALHMAIYWRKEPTIIEDIVKLMKPEMLECKRSDTGLTSLHIAAARGDTEAAKMMVDMNAELPQIRDHKGETPLELSLKCFTDGQQEIVEYLYFVTRDEEPSPFAGNEGARILCNAIAANFYDLASRIVDQFPELVMEKSSVHEMCGLEMLVRRPFAFKSAAKMTWWQNRIYSVIQVDAYAQQVEPNTCQSSSESKRDVQDNPPEVKGTVIDEENPLEEVTKAEESFKFPSSSDKGIFMSCLTQAPFIKKLYKKKLMHMQANELLKQMLSEIKKANDVPDIILFFEKNPNIIKSAIKHGLEEFVVELLNRFSYLGFNKLPKQRMIEMAIQERNEVILGLVCDCADRRETKIDLVSRTDDDGNTILHHAAKLAPSAQLNMVSGVALQMQREMEWFEGVAGIISEYDRSKRNNNGDTAQFIFQEQHEDLLKKAEDWMKDTSGSCMIVAALIATVAFAAAFTVPGGNISDTSSTKNGTPVFLGQSSFTVFVVADAFALFASITSALMFLAIYTSRYAEIDFLKSLPQKLILGLSTLFISMAAILVAFGASLFIIVGDRFPQAPIPIALFSCCPMVLFAWLQLPLFYEMVRSTSWGGRLRKHRYMSNLLRKSKKRKTGPVKKARQSSLLPL